MFGCTFYIIVQGDIMDSQFAVSQKLAPFQQAMNLMGKVLLFIHSFKTVQIKACDVATAA